MSQSPEEFSAAVVALQMSLLNMKKERDALWHVLHDVLTEIEIPSIKGFDTEKIHAVLTMKGLNDVS